MSNFGLPLELEAGKTYVIECEQVLTRETLNRLLTEEIPLAEKKFGVKFLLLGKGMRIARVSPEAVHAPEEEPWDKANLYSDETIARLLKIPAVAPKIEAAGQDWIEALLRISFDRGYELASVEVRKEKP